jgi:hypothetical protein
MELTYAMHWVKGEDNMNFALLHRFMTGTYYCYDVYLAEMQHMLGVLTCAYLIDETVPEGEDRERAIIELTLIDLQQEHGKRILSYSSQGPGNAMMTNGLLRYDATHACWMIAQLQQTEFIGLRTLQMREDGVLTLSPLCLLERVEREVGLCSLLDLEVREESYRLFVHRPDVVHTTAPTIVTFDVQIQDRWKTFQEQAVTQRDGNTKEPKNWQDWQVKIEQYMIPEGHYVQHGVFRPRQIFSHAHRLPVNQTEEVKIVQRREGAQAEMAVTLADGSTRICVLCSPESWLGLTRLPNQFTAKSEVEQWKLLLTGWQRADLSLQWVYRPDIGLPTNPNIPSYETPPWPGVDVAVIAGPSTAGGKRTFVSIMSMSQREEDDYQVEENISRRGKEYGSILSRGVCLTHEGQIVQESQGPFGLRPSLCRCQDLVVGVDRPEDGWRIWNWAATQEAEPHTVLRLGAACQRAYVCAEADVDWCWLVEELPEEVRVSKRDASTLAEIAPAGQLVGYHLLPNRDFEFFYPVPLEGHRNLGLIPYQGTLLLIVLDKQDNMELYQLR